VSWGIHRLTQTKRVKPYATLLLATLVLALSTRTIIRNTDWRSPESFWTTTVLTAPNDYRVHNNLGNVYKDQGRFQEAEQEYVASPAGKTHSWRGPL
jgi:Flp pilus assembly protein TadD